MPLRRECKILGCLSTPLCVQLQAVCSFSLRIFWITWLRAWESEGTLLVNGSLGPGASGRQSDAVVSGGTFGGADSNACSHDNTV